MLDLAEVRSGLIQLDRLDEFTKRRRRNYEVYTAFLAEHPDFFVAPRQQAGLETAWLCYPMLVAEGTLVIAPLYDTELCPFWAPP